MFRNLAIRSSRLLSSRAFSDTIFAVASGRVRSGVAVVRVSGPASGKTMQTITRKDVFLPRVATRAQLFHPQSGHKLDDGLVLHFPQPNSFTGESVVEYHIHGGTAVVRSVLDALSTVPGCRPARAGEFTKRAFENGKLDLTQAEGLADLINAETESQRKLAVNQMSGSLYHLYEDWRSQLIRCLAHIEAVIDFTDDEFIDSKVLPNAIVATEKLSEAIQGHLNDARKGERLRTGVNVVIAGKPNVGKSSLLNCLAQRDAAIVSDIAGTTRDVIDVALDIGGFPVIVTDTAGVRSTENPIEQEGISRAQQRLASADVQLYLLDGFNLICKFSQSIEEEVGDFSAKFKHIIRAETAELVSSEHAARPKTSSDTTTGNDDGESDALKLIVINKSDMIPPALQQHLAGLQSEGVYLISCLNGERISQLLQGLQTAITHRYESVQMDAPILTRERHRQHLTECLDALQRFKGVSGDIALAADELRTAATCLGRITGRTGVEEMLDVLFKDFCIGK